eukprot:4423068-Amphidinium_carterae.1
MMERSRLWFLQTVTGEHANLRITSIVLRRCTAADASICLWLDTQASVCSAEAELIALTTGLSEGTYVRNLLCDLLGFDAEIILYGVNSTSYAYGQ